MRRTPENVELQVLGGAELKRGELRGGLAWIALTASVALLVGWLIGCGAARPPKYYQLTVPADVRAMESAGAVPVTLLVGALMTSHLYREDRIVYGGGPERLGTYEYERWAEPPAEMIQEVLTRELRASGHYRAVQYQRSSMQGDFALRGRLYDFKELTGGQISARVTLELEMRDLKNGATVWTHYYTHDEPASGKDVPAVVAALDRCVQRGVKEVVESLDQYFAAHPAK
jgi:cholesterol transport system auxiliary component